MYVFVYGTLLSGQPNNYLLEKAEKMGTEIVSGFTMVDLGYFPACVEDKNSTTPILGEVWKINEEIFQRLDRLEGYPGFYNRKEVDTFAGKAWIYFCNEESDNPVVESGDWKKYLSERQDK